MIEFMKLYGAYLHMHTSLSCAAKLKAESIIKELLNVASYDPSYRDAMREIQKANNFIFYDPVSNIMGAAAFYPFHANTHLL